MSDDVAAELLEDAADHMEAHGWTQGVFKDDHGRVCLLGAVRNAGFDVGDVANSFRPWPAYAAALRHLAHVLGFGEEGGRCPTARATEYQHIVGWNDHGDRTAGEALDALRAAAKHARGVEG